MNREKLEKLSRVILFIVAFFFIFAAFNAKIWDPDFWWHLKTGEYIYQTESLPSTDPFAFTSLAKDPIHPESKRIRFILSQYWLAQIIFYLVYKAFSFHGIIYMRAAILTLINLLLYRSLRREGIGFFFALLLLAPSVIIFVNFTGERPQLFSFLFTFLLVYFLEGFKKASISRDNPGGSQLSDKKMILTYLLPIPVMVLLWSNMHGGVIIGLLVLLGYVFCETVKYKAKSFGKPLPLRSLKYLFAATIASFLFFLVNPNGYNVVPFLIELNKSQYMSQIVEAKSPLVFIKYGYYTQELYTFFSLLVGGFVLLLINIKKSDLTDIAIFLGMAALSLSAARIIPFFTPLSLLMVARYGLKTIEKLTSTAMVVNVERRLEKLRALASSASSRAAFFLICSVLIIVMINNGDYFQSGIRKGRYPEGAVEFLKANRVQGNMYNPYVWGGYLIWALYPDYKVFIDGRGLIEEVFFQSDKIMGASSLQLFNVPEWKAIIDAYNISFIVTFSISDFSGKLIPLISELYYDPHWHLVYMDNYSVIFVKDGTENREIIERFDMPKDWVWNEVLTEAAKKIRDFRGNANYYITMGDALVNKGDYGNALAAYLKAWQIAPQNNIVKDKLNRLQNINR